MAATSTSQPRWSASASFIAAWAEAAHEPLQSYRQEIPAKPSRCRPRRLRWEDSRMENDQPLLFTPLVHRPGEPPPDWLFGPAGAAGLPAALHLPQGVNVAVGIDIIEVERVRKVYEKHGERFLA